MPIPTVEAMSERMAGSMTSHRGKLYNGNTRPGDITPTQAAREREIATALQRIHTTIEGDELTKVDLYDTADVRARTIRYVEACQACKLFPSLSGLAGFAFGCSREWPRKFCREHPVHPTSQFLAAVKEMFADMMVGAGLSGSANYVMAIFQLKNGHNYDDRLQVEPVQPEPEGELSEADIRRMLDAYGVTDDIVGASETVDGFPVD